MLPGMRLVTCVDVLRTGNSVQGGLGVFLLDGGDRDTDSVLHLGTIRATPGGRLAHFCVSLYPGPLDDDEYLGREDEVYDLWPRS